MEWKERAHAKKEKQKQELAEMKARIRQFHREAPADRWEKDDWRLSTQIIQNLTEDPEKDRREQQCYCTYCHYAADRAVMDVLTTYECQRCHQSHIHDDSGVPILCMTCGQEEGVCVQCGNRM